MCRTTKLLFNLLVVLCCWNVAVEGSRDEEIAGLLRFNFFPRNTTQQVYTTSNLHTILSNPLFQTNRKTIIYFYGFTQVLSNLGVQAIRDAYIDNGNFNVVLMSIDNFFYTAGNVFFIADNTAQSLLRLTNAGYNPSHIEIAGFSLGANIAGVTGRRVTERSTGSLRISKIVGLDPGQTNDLALSPSDATFVMTMLTETRSFGSSTTLGHASFWVNGAVTQPMCPSGLLQRVCSHEQAQLFWTEAVRGNAANVFPARLCDNFNNFNANRCSTNEIGFMNLHANTRLRGIFFLNTNLQSPYSRPSANP